jgi:hypothetical protein
MTWTAAAEDLLHLMRLAVHEPLEVRAQLHTDCGSTTGRSGRGTRACAAGGANQNRASASFASGT